MTLYKESLRRLSRIGITLLAVTLIATTAMETQNCIWANEANAMLDSALLFNRLLLIFVYVAGLLFAYAGFSFLIKRSDSDFYHSLPITRTDLFLSVTMAALTWMIGTIFLSNLSVTIVHLITGRSFVLLYPLMNFLFYSAASLLVFAAAAIAMCVTGTWFSALIVTGIVLALPRFILFIVARTVAAKATNLINWLDFGPLLNPIYNAATAPIAQLVRPALGYDMMGFGPSLYSLGIAALELALACLFFKRRKSEIAEHGARNRWMQTLFACLAALPLILLVMSGRLSGIGKVELTGLSALALIVIVLSLAVYAAYQMIVLKNWKAMVKSLPWYALTVAVTIGIMSLSSMYGERVRSFEPSAEEIQSVSFLPSGRNADNSNITYRSMMVAKVLFTDQELLNYVATSYEETCAREEDGMLYAYYYGSNDMEPIQLPVKFTLKNGRTEVRNVFFPNQTTLETLRRQNPDYVNALGAFAPEESIRCRAEYYGVKLTNEDIEALRKSYEAEFPQDSLSKNVSDYALVLYPSNVMRRNDAGLVYGSFQIGGYIGTRTYVDTYEIIPEMEKTCSLWMEKVNLRADAVDYDTMMSCFTKALSDSADEWTSFNLDMTIYNVAIEGLAANSASMNIYVYGGVCDYSPEAQAIIIEAAKLLSKGTPSTNAKDVSIQARFWAQFDQKDTISISAPMYLRFDEATQARLIELYESWYELSKYPERMYNYKY